MSKRLPKISLKTEGKEEWHECMIMLERKNMPKKKVFFTCQNCTKLLELHCYFTKTFSEWVREEKAMCKKKNEQNDHTIKTA